MSETVGLVGVGLVGTALAENLLAAGFGVVGCDILPEKCRRLEELGGTAASGPAEVARRSRRVLLSLMTTETVCEVVEGPGGLLEAARPPSHVIDTTTGDPEATAALAERLAERGVAYLDATLSGSSRMIRERKGVFMVGGETAAFDACHDLFDALAESAFHLGPPGSGAKSKLAGNLVLGLNRAALAEGLVFAEALDLDLPAFLELLKQTPAYSAMMDAKGDKMLTGDFTPQSRIAQHHKDVTLILRAAGRRGQDLPLSRTHLDLLARAIDAGDADLDTAAIIREIRRRKG
jgi:3-hydroxyisobutyrate dehydrogenase-like beta-hydroxyacid dehydrogenase